MTSLVCNCNGKAQYTMQWEKHVICFHSTDDSSLMHCNYAHLSMHIRSYDVFSSVHKID